MKRFLLAAVVSAAAGMAVAADVGVSISIGDPNFFGRIDIGNLPRPPLIYPEPIVIQRPRVVLEPIYLRVPPGHAKNWKKYCGRYSACGRPVYFVQDRWYRDDYAPRYRERREYKERHDYERRVERRARDDWHGNERGWDDRRDDRGGRGHDKGRDREHGRGHGRD